MDLRTIFGPGSVVVIIALVQALKGWFVFRDPTTWPPLAIALGIILNVAIAGALGTPLVEGGIMGLIAGLTASGLFSIGKTYGVVKG